LYIYLRYIDIIMTRKLTVVAYQLECAPKLGQGEGVILIRVDLHIDQTERAE
jgi:hypothetical protein